ncbi:unnamed protein product [Caenorhabditis brenneri]
MKSYLPLFLILCAFADLVHGFTISPSDATPNTRDATTQTTITRAPRPRRPSFGGQNPHGLKFGNRIMGATKTGNPDVISGLFNANFTLKACEKTYNKEQIVNFLAHPKTPGDYFLITVDYYKPLEDKFEIKFRARSNIDADLYTIKATAFTTDQRIIEASVLNCPAKE